MSEYICIRTLHVIGKGVCPKGKKVSILKMKANGYGIERAAAQKNPYSKWWMTFSQKDLDNHFRKLPKDSYESSAD